MLAQFKKCVESHVGLCFRNEDSAPFCKALSAGIQRWDRDTPEEYLCFLEADTEESRKEWKELVLMLTTGESYFFRDKGHYSLLRNSILPEMLKKKEAQRSLRLWSAGCSTGEEPYSLAILLDKLVPEPAGWNIFILGTDINEAFLEKAKNGIYSEWSFRMVDKGIQREYFTKLKDGWEIRDDIKKMVKFHYGNLLEADFSRHHPEICAMDIIICRNVFIYFKAEAVAAVLQNFTSILNDEGYLVTGHGELHGHDLANLKQIIYPEAVIYKKTETLTQQIPEISRSPQRKKDPHMFKLKAEPALKPILPAAQVKSKPSDPKAEIEDLISKGRYAEAVEKAKGHLLADKGNDDMLFLMAESYANCGDYENAENCCRKAIQCNAAAADPYFLLAHIAELLGNDEKAKELFRKTIYLNPAYIAAYCELGGIYEKQQDLPRAKKIRATAIDLLASLPEQTPVKPYDITAGELLSSIRSLRYEQQ